MLLSFYIGIMAGAIFFIDAWGPSKEGTAFLKSRRFRGLSIILAGGIITPAIDYINKDSRAPFFLDYLRGCVWGWFWVFLLGLVLFVLWKLMRNSKNARVRWAGEFSFIVLDFIYLGIADNPHLNAQRDSDLGIDKAIFDAKLKELQSNLEARDTAPKDLDESIDTQNAINSYVNRLIVSKYEKDYNFHDWYYKGIYEYNKNELEKTIAYIKNALTKDARPEEKPEALLYLAIAYDDLSMRQEAMRYYDQIIDQYPDYPRLYLAWYDKATSLYEEKHYKKAAAAFDKAVLLNTTSSDVYFNQGLNYEELKEYDRALDAYQRASDLNPGDAEILRVKGNVLLELGSNEEALAAFEQALKLREDGTILYDKAVALQELKRVDDSLETYKKALSYLPRDTDILYNIGILYVEKKAYNEAIGFFNRVLAIRPRDLDSLYQKATALENMGQYEDALENFDAVLEIDPDDADVWFDKAVTLEKLGRNEESLRAYNKSISFDKTDAVTWFRKGELLETMNRNEDALKAYDKATLLQPDYAEAWYNKATMLAFLKNYQSALEAYEKVLTLNPNNADAWFSKGTVLDNMGSNTAALQAYETAIGLNPNDALSWYNKSLVLEKLGNLEGAWAAMERAKEIDPAIKLKAVSVNGVDAG